MRTSDIKIGQAAEMLRNARRTCVPCAPIRDLIEASDIEAAAAIRTINQDYREKSGSRIVGFKIGLTSKAAQKQLGVSECDAGMLFAEDVFREDEDIPFHQLIQARAEGEIAIVLERDLTLERPTVADVIRATAFCLPAIEIVDCRIKNWDIKIEDAIADNGVAQFVVLGAKPVRLMDVDFELCGMKMQKNGDVVSVGIGSVGMGSPLNALAWLAGKRAALGKPLAAGSIVLTGALGPPVPVVAADKVEVRIEGLGSVRARFSSK